MSSPSSLPPDYVEALERSIAVARERGVPISLESDQLCLKDAAGSILSQYDPNDMGQYFPGDAAEDVKQFLARSFEVYAFNELTKDCDGVIETNFGFAWEIEELYSVLGSGYYHHGFGIDFELSRPMLNGNKKIRLTCNRIFENWPTPLELAICHQDLGKLKKDWELLLKFQVYLASRKKKFDVNGRKYGSHIRVSSILVTARGEKLLVRPGTTTGEWDTKTTNSFQRIEKDYANYLVEQLIPPDEMPALILEVDLI